MVEQAHIMIQKAVDLCLITILPRLTLLNQLNLILRTNGSAMPSKTTKLMRKRKTERLQ